MRRREFIWLVGGAAATWPVAARGQQPTLPIIGFLIAGTPATHGAWFAGLERRLEELGWVSGRTARIESRWAEGRGERFGELAAEFVRMKVDVIVTSGAALQRAKQATSTIPIVFAIAADPVGD